MQNEFLYTPPASTFNNSSALLMAAIVALHSPEAGLNTAQSVNGGALLQASYSLMSNPATYNHINMALFSVAPNSLEKEVSHCYSRLLGSQEPLGVEFARVLHDNLWDLYES